MDFVGDYRKKQQLAEALRGRSQGIMDLSSNISGAPIVTQGAGAFPGMVQANWGDALAKLGTAWMAKKSREKETAAAGEATDARVRALESVLGNIGESKEGVPSFSQTIQLQELGVDPSLVREFVKDKKEGQQKIGAYLQAISAGFPVDLALKLRENVELTPEEMKRAQTGVTQYQKQKQLDILEQLGLKGRNSMNLQGAKDASRRDEILLKHDLDVELDALKQGGKVDLVKLNAQLKEKGSDVVLGDALEEYMAAAESGDPEAVARAKEKVEFIKSVTQKNKEEYETTTFMGKTKIPEHKLGSAAISYRKNLDDSEGLFASTGKMKDLAIMANNDDLFTRRNAWAARISEAAGGFSGITGSVLTGLANKLMSGEGGRFNASTMDMILNDMGRLGGSDSNEELARITRQYPKLDMDPDTVRSLINDLGRWSQAAALAKRLRADVSATPGLTIGNYHQYAQKIIDGEVENPYPDVDFYQFKKPDLGKVSESGELSEELQGLSDEAAEMFKRVRTK